MALQSFYIKLMFKTNMEWRFSVPIRITRNFVALFQNSGGCIYNFLSVDLSLDISLSVGQSLKWINHSRFALVIYPY